MEFDKCFFCRSADSQFLYGTDHYNLRKCNNCQLVFKSQLQEQDVGELNAELYDEKLTNYRLKNRKRGVFLAKKRRKVVAKYLLGTAKILEIGPATGEFIECALEKGYEIEAVETAKPFVEFLREQYGIYCHEGYLDSLPQEHGDYDAVVLFHVLEHISDPSYIYRTNQTAFET
ncbi:MAG: methyltransferase domain-containing protein [Phycisphaerae bacterium]|nr:methyltransferase domain-containing protein [Phycisphaerae bacterium]